MIRSPGPLALALALAASVCARPVSAQDAPGWEDGDRLVELGDWERALEVWDAAYERLGALGRSDLRIGVSYIETVVREGRTELYPLASEIYIWGLGDTSAERREVYRAELERAMVGIPDPDSTRWRRLVDDDPAELSRELRLFWIEADPTPATRANERLIEHWARIAEARRRFVYERTPPFGTDDRGDVFVRYGEPDRVARGSLGASEMEMRLRVPSDPEARQRLRAFDPNPQYEVWIYEDLAPDGELAYLLFGAEGGVGRFKQVDGVTDLIYDAARSANSRRSTPGGIKASFYMELFYYQDLQRLGGPFARRYSELERHWNDATFARGGFLSASRQTPTPNLLESISYRFQEEDRYDRTYEPARPLKSPVLERPTDPLVGAVMRTTDAQGEPRLVVIGASAARFSASQGALDGTEVGSTAHQLLIRDGDYERVGTLDQLFTADQPAISTFLLRQPTQPLHLTLSSLADVTVRDDDEEGDVDEETEDPESSTLVQVPDRLPGRLHFRPGPPLEFVSPDSLLISDVVLGTPLDPRTARDEGLYPLLPTETIWLGDPLRLYIEILAFAGASEGLPGELSVTVEVTALDPDTDQTPIRLRVPLQIGRRIYPTFFDVGLSDREPGRYAVSLTVRDLRSGREVSREGEILLVSVR